MLTQLLVNNFAIIDKLEIDFKDGLIVLTGETGAGKSIILDALDFLLGARSSVDLIKSTANKAQVEGVFFLSDNLLFCLKLFFEKNGFEISNKLIISRELTKDGSKARINGSLANISHLLFLREYLLDIHEQSGHTELLKTEKQLEILDNSGNTAHKKLIEEYKNCFEDYTYKKAKLTSIQESSQAITKEIDFLAFQTEEIKKAKINNINEESELTAKREVLLNKKELLENANTIYSLINEEGENNLSLIFSQIKKLIVKSASYDKSFEPYIELVENTTTSIKELSSFVNSYSESICEDENMLNEIEERLDLFYRLKKKYGNTLQEILDTYQKLEQKLNELQSINISQEELEKEVKQKEHEINFLAEKLTKSRETVTRDFVDRVNEEIKTLGFKHVVFVVEFIPCEVYYGGKEQIQFLFTANPDEPPKPLLKVASGGELSRIMLGIKSIACRDNRPVAPTMIFDEIDAGVSGEIASSVAKKLYKISRQNQLIAITHQPIICAMADSHFVVEKKVINEVTHVTLREVTQVEKAEALATLLTPDKKLKEGITEDARVFAKSLLENARKIKEKVGAK